MAGDIRQGRIEEDQLKSGNYIMNFNTLSETDQEFLLDHLRDMREDEKEQMGQDYEERELSLDNLEEGEKEELIEAYVNATEDYRDYEAEQN